MQYLALISKSSNRHKRLLINNAILLIEPLSHKTCLVSLNIPIRFGLNLILHF